MDDIVARASDRRQRSPNRVYTLATPNNLKIYLVTIVAATHRIWYKRSSISQTALGANRAADIVGIGVSWRKVVWLLN